MEYGFMKDAREVVDFAGIFIIFAQILDFCGVGGVCLGG